MAEAYVKKNPNPSLGTDDERIEWLCGEHSRCLFWAHDTNPEDTMEAIDLSDHKDDDSDSYSSSDYYENDSVREAYEEMYDELDGIRNEYASDNDSGWYE